MTDFIRALLLLILVPGLISCAAGSLPEQQANDAAPAGANAAVELAVIEQTVRDSIAWAKTKDRLLLESIIAHDDDYFCFHPEGLDAVHGYDEFLEGFDLWMDERFVATRFEMRGFRAHLSRSGDVAWWSAIIDDCFEWDGRPGCWEDTRWTGVLEKRDGRWVIMQMHFSFAADREAGGEEATAASSAVGPS